MLAYEPKYMAVAYSFLCRVALEIYLRPPVLDGGGPLPRGAPPRTGAAEEPRGAGADAGGDGAARVGDGLAGGLDREAAAAAAMARSSS